MKRASVDVIAGQTSIDYTYEWMKLIYDRTGKEFGDTIGDHTGQILYKFDDEFKNSRDYSIEYQGWKLTLFKITDKLTGEHKAILRIKGNPSAIYYGRKKNYRNIPVEDFRAILLHCTNTFNVDIDTVVLTVPYEPSVTVVLNTNELLLNEEKLRGMFILFQDKNFHLMLNATGKWMGYEATNSHYSVKIYLPSVKFNEPLNSLRVELHYNRIKTFKKRTGIETWGDILSDESIYKCYQVVLDAWDDVIVFDPKLRRNKKYPEYLNQIIRHGKYPEFWLNDFPLTASDKTRKKRLEEYRDLCFQKGVGVHSKIKNWIMAEAEKFRNVTACLVGNISELEGNSIELSKDCINNNKMGSTTNITQKEELINNDHKSKKQLAKDIRVAKEKQFQSFLKSVGITIQKMQLEGANN